MTKLVLASVIALLASALSIADAYVTSLGAVPVQRQIQWLKEITNDICQAKPGELTSNQLSQAPDLMYAWSHIKSSSKECALAVEHLVKRIIDERRAGNTRAPDLIVDDYNCLLEGWAKSGQGEAAAERCEAILEGMQQNGPMPNLSSFKATLMAWREAGSASYIPIRVQRILEWMIRLYKEGANDGALPDADCFDIVMQIWSRSGRSEAPKQTEKILGAMERLYESTGLERVKPRRLSFNAVLAAWSKSGSEEAAARAMAILSFMELLASRGDPSVAPDAATYNIVMGSFWNESDTAATAKKAGAVLRHAEDARQRNPSLQLDTILFNTAMGFWAKSNKHGAYQKARSILERQTALFIDGCSTCKPDVFSYTSVIASCAAEAGSTEDRANAFEVAVQTYGEVRLLNNRPNHVTYGAMLKACARLLSAASASRTIWVRKIFVECVESGFVGDMVVSRLREAASSDLYRELMQGHNKRSLPIEWTRNVNEMNEFRKRKRRRRAEV